MVTTGIHCKDRGFEVAVKKEEWLSELGSGGHTYFTLDIDVGDIPDQCQTTFFLTLDQLRQIVEVIQEEVEEDVNAK